MDVEVSRIASAIGEPARARMLYCLMDGHARTSTELAMVAEVSPSTASVHLNRLKTARLVKGARLKGNIAITALKIPMWAVRLKDSAFWRRPLRQVRTKYAKPFGALGTQLL